MQHVSNHPMNTTNNPISVAGLDHVVIRCTHLELTLDFYQTVLGCKLERVVEDLGLYQLRAGGALIDLVAVGSKLGGMHDPDREKQNMDHFCLKLATADWPRIQSHLLSNAIECRDPGRRYGADGFGLSLYINDPEGNTVELKGPPQRN